MAINYSPLALIEGVEGLTAYERILAREAQSAMDRGEPLPQRLQAGYVPSMHNLPPSLPVEHMPKTPKTPANFFDTDAGWIENHDFQR